MRIFVGVITAVFAIGAIAEKNKEKRDMHTLCFLVSMTALTLISIF